MEPDAVAVPPPSRTTGEEPAALAPELHFSTPLRQMTAATPVVLDLPPALMRLFPGSAQRVEVSAFTVGEALDALNARWPGMRDRLVDSTPRIRRNINVFVAGKRASLETRLAPGAEIIVRIAMIG